MKDNKAQLINEISHRLRYLTLVAPDEDFNVDEIQLLVSLLQIYEPSEISEEEMKKQLDKMWEYIELRAQDEELLSTQKEKSILTSLYFYLFT